MVTIEKIFRAKQYVFDNQAKIIDIKFNYFIFERDIPTRIIPTKTICIQHLNDQVFIFCDQVIHTGRTFFYEDENLEIETKQPVVLNVIKGEYDETLVKNMTQIREFEIHLNSYMNLQMYIEKEKNQKVQKLTK